MSIGSILSAQGDLFTNAIGIDPSATQAQPIRPVRDGSFITTSLTSSTPFPPQTKPLLISTVKNEAGSTIYGAFPDPLPEFLFPDVVNGALGPARTNVITSTPAYQSMSLTEDDARPQIEKLGTDYIWKCSAWTFTRNWVQNGGRAYVGLYTVGATYPTNQDIPFCTQAGSVCHEADIQIVVRLPLSLAVLVLTWPRTVRNDGESQCCTDRSHHRDAATIQSIPVQWKP